MVHETCSEVVLASLKEDKFDFFTQPPNMRDVFHILSETAKLSRVLVENKKMFTRHFVHEAMRTYYDRLSTPAQRLKLFESLKSCVKTIFRENFDSAFEHLGKVNGQVCSLPKNMLFV